MARVLLAVSGGIAAYKAPDLVRALKRAGHEVRVIVTRGARNFVQAPALAAVSGNSVRHELFDEAGEASIGHIELADWPDLVVVAPATAHTLARLALGLADDLVTTVLLACRAPCLVAPAMNPNMWQHPATQHHVLTLRSRGYSFIGPDRGELACGWVGEGRMIDPPLIVDAVARILAPSIEPVLSRWAGRAVLVSAGPTRVYLDPVRFVTNRSSGQMGFELAAALVRFGARVTLVSGPVERTTPPGVERINVETAQEMYATLDARLSAQAIDAVLMVAAVADVRLDTPPAGKLEKDELLTWLAGLHWQRERDILAELCRTYGQQTRFLGFAAQTLSEKCDAAQRRTALVELGRAKLERKGCQALFVNRVGAAGSGFGTETNAGHLIFRDGRCLDFEEPIPKSQLAQEILDALAHPWFSETDS